MTIHFSAKMSDSMSVVEFENMEQKYLETKAKLKKTVQYNERYSLQIQKLNKRLKRLETENKQLESQVKARDTSESDVSSPVNLHQERANMIDLVHSKNQQISDLLKDIEDMENENTVLREKLVETKDQLSVATSEITDMTDKLKTAENVLADRNEMLKNITSELGDLKGTIEAAKSEKADIEKQLAIIKSQAKEQEEKWEVLLQEKESQISVLKRSLPQALTAKSSLHSEREELSETRSREEEKLKLTLSATEQQLSELKSEMENCVAELRQSAEVINTLKRERQLLETKLKSMKEVEKSLTDQVKKARERCQTMQNEVELANKLTKMFETDLSSIKEQMKENGQYELVNHLEDIQGLKIEKMLHEKQIVGLVKDINKIQEMFNILQIENANLREQLGLPPDYVIDLDPEILNESKKEKKLIGKLQMELRHYQEDKIRLKLEIKSLKQQIASFINKENEPNSDLGKDMSLAQFKDDRSADIKALSEENEALRKGLHEILNSVQVKNETSPRELKSDVLERLLKALDVKHISGWYHPAMRLQAELHTLEGVNTELREQLHEARNELDKLKLSFNIANSREEQSEKEVVQVTTKLTNGESKIMDGILSADTSCIEKIKTSVLNILLHFMETEANVALKLEREFEIVKDNLNLLHQKCQKERVELVEKLKLLEQELDSPIIDVDRLNSKDLPTMLETERKKSKHLFNQLTKLQDEYARAKSDLSKLCKTHHLELELVLRHAVELQAKLYNRDVHHCIGSDIFKELQSSLNEQVKKYRQLLSDVEEQYGNRDLEIGILKQIEIDLIKENNELKGKLNKTMTKLNQEINKQDPNVISLSQKLADAEVETLSEKNRANHTNNLYELVKGQLKKSEEKFAEFSKFGDGLVQKNLLLQERIVALEDQLVVGDTPDLHQELEEKLKFLVEENGQLIKDNAALSEKLQEVAESTQQATNWTQEKEQELLGLKHEILDLTATSDERAVIDNLYCDLSKSRLNTREYQLQVDFLRKEVSIWEARYTKLWSEMGAQRSYFETARNNLEIKIRTLKDIILKQRIQYHGCVALTNQELLVEKLNTIQKERREAFQALHSVVGSEKSQKSSSKVATSEHEMNYDSGKRQIDYLQQKIQKQDMDLERLEKELFSAYQLANFDVSGKEFPSLRKRKPILVTELVSQEFLDPVATATEKTESKIIILRNMDCQTETLTQKDDEQLIAARIQLNNLQNQISVKDNSLLEKQRLLLEKEKDLSECREQVRRSRDEIVTLENQLAGLRVNLEHAKMLASNQHHGGAGDGAGLQARLSNQEFLSLKAGLKVAQDRIRQKDSEIIKYQNLLKDDRDKHSLAAANLQKELVVLRQALLTEQQNAQSFQRDLIEARNKSTVVEKYISQVRALEKHLAELHTKQAQLQAQLQNSHQEAVRWREMAHDRLLAMQQLGKSLNDQHNKELNNYKTDYEKLKELAEDEPSKKATSDQKLMGYIDPDILKLCREKDGKIEELASKLKQLEAGDTRYNAVNCEHSSTAAKASRFKEYEILKGKYEVMVNKERTLKDELKDLREQLSKKTNLSARSHKSEKSVKEQLQKRISFLEREIDELNKKLTYQQLVNEKHKLNASEDFEKWKKQKFWQETCEKYKAKLQEREEEFQKLQQTCTGYRMLIERLEREKINLENRVKALKSDQRNIIFGQEKDILKLENDRLACELASVQAKLEMRQHGDGALSTAVMQEKLEAQERKIAVLELSTKGTVEMRNELERLQTSLASLQKSNLCMEAENLELKMDLEKYIKEAPHLQEQILHLENYIELLKDENQRQASTASDAPCAPESSEDKKVSQLERTVFILKRVVEKLQVENKRLLSGKRPISERSSSADKLRRDHLRLKEQYTESLQKIKTLESHLLAAKKLSRNRMSSEEVEKLREQLEDVNGRLLQKTHLLEKVKALLHTAAAKEKQLLKQISELKSATVQLDHQLDIPSPIEEVSEISSDD